MRRVLFVVVVALLFTQAAIAADPGAAIGKAKQALNDKRYDEAIQLLQSAIPDAAALAEPQHSQALAAIHFFTAIAFNGLKNDDKTREELLQFFAFNPNAKALDASRYDAGFVKIFNQVSKEPRLAVAKISDNSFDAVYPGFANYRLHEPVVSNVAQWGDGPDLELLGTPEEKRKWRALSDDDARRAFIDAFWKEHDQDGSRKEYLRRVTFADETFSTPKTRGSLTDRGRVFVLLGPPRVINQRPLTAKDGAFNRAGGASATRNINTAGPSNLSGNMREAMVNDINQETVLAEPTLGGTVERWLYSRDQLPATVRNTDIALKFVTQQGYGDHVLQRDLLVNKLLTEAGGGK